MPERKRCFPMVYGLRCRRLVSTTLSNLRQRSVIRGDVAVPTDPRRARADPVLRQNLIPLGFGSKKQSANPFRFLTHSRPHVGL